MRDARLDGTEIADSVIDLIGNTPLVRMKRVSEDQGIRCVLAMKTETTNPGGSSKDRPALEMILAAERDGLLQPGGTIVEPTSGNTGVGLAIVAAQRGYKCVFVMTDKVGTGEGLAPARPTAPRWSCARSPSHRTTRRATTRSPSDSPTNCNAFRPNQYANPNNPLAHEQTTGPELWRQTNGRITHFVAGAGTCGSITGVARYLKSMNPDDQDHRRRPRGLGVLRRVGSPVPRRGRRRGLLPGGLGRRTCSTRSSPISDEESFLTARYVSETEGILIGGSGGMAVAAAIKVAKAAGPDDIVVVFNPDSGRGYLSRVFDDDWMANFGFLEECDQCVGAVLDTRNASIDNLLYVNPHQTVSEADRRSCAPTASASCRCARTRRRSPPPRCRAPSTSSS